MGNQLEADCEAELGYGYCPICGAKGVSRERRPDGNDACENNHFYPSSEAKAMPYWVFTFGSGQRHENCYVRVFAKDCGAARQKMFDVFGPQWGMQYDTEKEAGVQRFNLRQIPDIHA